MSISDPGDRFEQAAEASAARITAGTALQREAAGGAGKFNHSPHLVLQRTITVTKEQYIFDDADAAYHALINKFENVNEYLLKYYFYILNRQNAQFHNLVNLIWDI